MSAVARQWHKHVLKTRCGGAWLEPHSYPRSCACVCPEHVEMLMRVQLVFTKTTIPPPTPSFLSVLFHHQLHPRKPKGARVTHRGRKGLRWMGGCDFTCQVCQMWMQIHSNNEQWQNFVENVIKWRCLGVHICVLQLQKLGQWARESHAEVPSSASDCGDGENCC